MAAGIIVWFFGLLFNLAVAGLVVGVLLIMRALWGDVEMVWLNRAGLSLQVLGITLFTLEYVGVAQQGQSLLRWWLRKLTRGDAGTVMPALWPRQMILIVGASALVLGLLLQVLSWWSLGF